MAIHNLGISIPDGEWMFPPVHLMLDFENWRVLQLFVEHPRQKPRSVKRLHAYIASVAA